MKLQELFSYNLRKLRNERRLTKTQFMKLIGLKSTASMYLYEHGQNGSIRFELLERICEACDVPPSALFEPIDKGIIIPAPMVPTVVKMEEEDEEEVEEEIEEEESEQPGRLRIPKRMFHASRIEMREMIEEDGLYARVDLFESPGEALAFVGGPPCDVYSIRAGGYLRKHLELVEGNKLWKLYSYHNHIPRNRIQSRSTYR